MSKRALLLINRRAGRGAPALSQAVESLHGLDFELVTAPVKNAEHITARIEQYGPQLDLVIVGGGDGTLNAAVDSLVQYQLPLGILPQPFQHRDLLCSKISHQCNFFTLVRGSSGLNFFVILRDGPRIWSIHRCSRPSWSAD